MLTYMIEKFETTTDRFEELRKKVLFYSNSLIGSGFLARKQLDLDTLSIPDTHTLE